MAIDAREKWRACLGAALGTLGVALGVPWLMAVLGHEPVPAQLALWMVAPLGASAVLVFAVPSSPLAQPWAVLGGNTVSALIGIACVHAVPEPAAAAALAVGLAILAMMALRCLHPPGGAAALLMVLNGVSDFGFALEPVLLDSVLLVAAGMLYNSLTGRRYPHVNRTPPADGGTRLTRSDLDAALAHYNQVMDVNRGDLEFLLRQAEAAAYRRTLGDLYCADVMTRSPVTARIETPLRQAWALMRQRRVKALPIVDRLGHLVGIVTVAHFMRQVDLDVHEGLGHRLRDLVRRRKRADASPVAGTVGQIMTRQVRVASGNRLLMDLVPVFSEGGHRHIPILDEERRLVGIITQSDLIKALYAAVRS